VPDEKVRDEPRAMVRVFPAKSRIAMRLGRAVFRRAKDDRPALPVHWKISDCRATSDEGMRAFIEKFGGVQVLP